MRRQYKNKVLKKFYPKSLQSAIYPGNKSKEFPRILQPRWLSLRDFRRISREPFPVTGSSEILEKFPRIGPQDERFLWDHSFKTQFWEILEKFREILWGKIPQNFLGLGHHVYGFLEEFMKRINFKKILKISPDYFSGNSWEILRTWSLILT